MGGSTTSSHCQYETVVRSSWEESRTPCRSRDKIDLTGFQRNTSSAGNLLNNYGKRDCVLSNQPFHERLDDSSRILRKNNVSENICVSGCKPPRRFVSDKVVLELRSHLKPICRCSHGSETEYACSNVCKCNSVDVTGARQYSSEMNSYTAFVDQKALNGTAFKAICGVKSGTKTAGHSTENHDVHSCSAKKTSNPPTKIMLQLCSRDSRPSRANRASVESLQLRERPAYARRFMLARPKSNTSISSPSGSDSGTSELAADSNLGELPQFVLPPLPLGLRPLSPEPRNLLLNAPKKRRFPSPCRTSDPFDLSSLTSILTPCEEKNLNKRPVCRELRFGD